MGRMVEGGGGWCYSLEAQWGGGWSGSLEVVAALRIFDVLGVGGARAGGEIQTHRA